ncbi:MAG: peptidoglycan recognition family protein, partial [Phycisphaerae bacterium]|nr:peptidoglycan recognition family protein [Phycisphaerae bacterium]
MRKMLLLPGVAVLMALAAGCQKIEYKVVTELPPPVFGDEAAAIVKPAPGQQVAAVEPHQGSGKVAVEPPRVVGPKVARAPVPDWETHSADNNWQYIIIHHSASARGSASAFDREHRARGWDELGYHFVIGNGSETRDGQVEVGPRWRTQKHGAHTKTNDNRYNDFGIGVCLVGDFETGGRPSAAHLAAVQQLVTSL